MQRDQTPHPDAGANEDHHHEVIRDDDDFGRVWVEWEGGSGLGKFPTIHKQGFNNQHEILAIEPGELDPLIEALQRARADLREADIE